MRLCSQMPFPPQSTHLDLTLPVTALSGGAGDAQGSEDVAQTTHARYAHLPCSHFLGAYLFFPLPPSARPITTICPTAPMESSTGGCLCI